MLEVLRVSILGFNLIPTAFLVLMIFYWLVTMAGLVHDHSFDGDIDHDIDSDGLFHSILIFFRMNEIPVALLMSFITLFWWLIATVVTILCKCSILMTGILIIPELIGAYLLTITLLSPFRKFFREIKGGEKDTVIESKLCKLVTNLEPGRIGQASIETSGAPILINVKSSNGTPMKTGDNAVVLFKDDKSDIYEIKQMKDIINPNVTGGNQ